MWAYILEKANNHLMGAGCSACKMSKLERAVSNYLKKNIALHMKCKKNLNG